MNLTSNMVVSSARNRSSIGRGRVVAVAVRGHRRGVDQGHDAVEGAQNGVAQGVADALDGIELVGRQANETDE